MSAVRDAKRRRAKGTAATTRNRKVVCTACNVTGYFAFGTIMRVGMPKCPACEQRFEWGTDEDKARAGLIDARLLPAKELRRLGWADSIQPRSRGRRRPQRQCDNGCARFVSIHDEKCAGGHWQQWAIHRGLHQNDGIPF